MPTSVGSATDGIAEPHKMTAAERRVFLRILNWRFSSDSLTFDGLGEIADAILHAVDEWIDRLRLPIGIQCVRLVIVLFQYRSEFGQRSEILRLQGERVAQRGQRI